MGQPSLDLHRFPAALVALCRTNRFHWHGAKLVLAMGKGAGMALAAVTLGIELKAQLGGQQTGCLSQFLRRVCKIAVVTHTATLSTPMLAHLGEFQGVSSLLGGHLNKCSLQRAGNHRRRRPMDQMWSCLEPSRKMCQLHSLAWQPKSLFHSIEVTCWQVNCRQVMHEHAEIFTHTCVPTTKFRAFMPTLKHITHYIFMRLDMSNMRIEKHVNLHHFKSWWYIWTWSIATQPTQGSMAEAMAAGCWWTGLYTTSDETRLPTINYQSFRHSLSNVINHFRCIIMIMNASQYIVDNDSSIG